jgi:hypothetical protein
MEVIDGKKSNIVLTITTLFLAFLIISASFLKVATIRYAYSPMVLSETKEVEELKPIEYYLAYQGKINPDSLLWYGKALRDKVWYLVTFDSLKKAELNLLFSDKRLNSSIELFKNNKPDLGLSTLTKAEKYLLKASDIKHDDNEFLKKLATATLKHIEVINTEILPNCPEDLKPQVTLTLNTTYMVFESVRNEMLSKGLVAPNNPYEKR